MELVEKAANPKKRGSEGPGRCDWSTHVTASYELRTASYELRATRRRPSPSFTALPHARTPFTAHAHVASMAAAPQDDEQQPVTTRAAGNGRDDAAVAAQHAAEDNDDQEDEDEDDDDDADDEPKLKYSRLTSSLGPVYRNGDATSSFLVAGDKMVWSHSRSRRLPPELLPAPRAHCRRRR